MAFPFPRVCRLVRSLAVRREMTRPEMAAEHVISSLRVLMVVVWRHFLSAFCACSAESESDDGGLSVLVTLTLLCSLGPVDLACFSQNGPCRYRGLQLCIHQLVDRLTGLVVEVDDPLIRRSKTVFEHLQFSDQNRRLHCAISGTCPCTAQSRTFRQSLEDAINQSWRPGAVKSAGVSAALYALPQLLKGFVIECSTLSFTGKQMSSIH